jgi:hypothetical protein
MRPYAYPQPGMPGDTSGMYASAAAAAAAAGAAAQQGAATGEWPSPLYTGAPPAGGAAPTDWSGYTYPMKEPDAGGAPAGATGPEAGYDYYAEYFKQQQAAAAAAASLQQQQAPTYTDPYGGAVDMQSYQAAYAAAVGQMMPHPSQGSAAFYPSSAYDPAAAAGYMQQLALPMMHSAPTTPQSTTIPGYPSAATPTAMSLGLGWQGGMQLASPSRMQAAAQLQKGFGSTGHGAGQTEKRSVDGQDDSNVLRCSCLHSFACVLVSRAGSA